LSTIYTFSSVALPETLSHAQLSCVHGLVSVCNTADISVFLYSCILALSLLSTFVICKYSENSFCLFVCIFVAVTLWLRQCTFTGWPQTWKTQGILGKFSATSGKNCNKQNVFNHHSNICETAVDWVNRIIRISRSRDPTE